MFNGKPRWVTAHSQLNDFNSWRDHPDEGVLYDIVDEKVVVKGLSSPHFPRWYKNKLWMLQSGKGEFGSCHHDSSCLGVDGINCFYIIHSVLG